MMAELGKPKKMSSKQTQFHIFFLPFFAPGHMIPAMDMVRLFVSRGIKSSIVTTPANLHYFAKPGLEINLLTMNFPSNEVELPQGLENFDCVTSPEMFQKFFKAVDLLQHPFTKLMDKYRPNSLVADAFFPWANVVAKKFEVPRFAFHGSNYFSRCVVYNLLRYKPHEKLSSDSESFIVPGGLPNEIWLTNSELAPYDKNQGSNFLLELMSKIREGIRECYGVIMNSFYELESGYIDYYENVMGLKQWHVGPFLLYNNVDELLENNNLTSNCNRGKSYSIDVSECKRWLDEKEVNSVIYICLGSLSNVSNAQLHEIAIALEDLGQNFILVVRMEETKEWIEDGFEERTKGRGLIYRGWAPQLVILNHPSVGGFVTHCGWNSILEGVVAGVAMLTWPLHAEQFYNEKLVTDVLKIGIQVGAKQWVPRVGNHNILIGNKQLFKGMKRVMMGEEAKDMRCRVNELKGMARKAILNRGSSCSQLDDLIGEMKSYKIS